MSDVYHIIYAYFETKAGAILACNFNQTTDKLLHRNLLRIDQIHGATPLIARTQLKLEPISDYEARCTTDGAWPEYGIFKVGHSNSDSLATTNLYTSNVLVLKVQVAADAGLVPMLQALLENKEFVHDHGTRHVLRLPDNV